MSKTIDKVDNATQIDVAEYNDNPNLGREYPYSFNGLYVHEENDEALIVFNAYNGTKDGSCVFAYKYARFTIPRATWE